MLLRVVLATLEYFGDVQAIARVNEALAVGDADTIGDRTRSYNDGALLGRKCIELPHSIDRSETCGGCL